MLGPPGQLSFLRPPGSTHPTCWDRAFSPWASLQCFTIATLSDPLFSGTGVKALGAGCGGEGCGWGSGKKGGGDLCISGCGESRGWGRVGRYWEEILRGCSESQHPSCSLSKCQPLNKRLTFPKWGFTRPRLGSRTQLFPKLRKSENDGVAGRQRGASGRQRKKEKNTKTGSDAERV